MLFRLLLTVAVAVPVLADEPANPKVKEYEATLEILRVQTTKGIQRIGDVFDEETGKLKQKLLELLKQELDAKLKEKDLDGSVALRDGIKELENYTPMLHEEKDTAAKRKFDHALVKSFDSRIKLLRLQATRAIARMESGFEQEANKLRDELAESLMADVDAAMESKDLEAAITLRDLAKEIQSSNPKLDPAPIPAPAPVKEQPPLAIAPFSAEEAQRHQNAWADYLGVPVELTNSIGMKLKLVPPGTFMMGVENGPERERPVHQVTLTRPFYIGVHEVTQEQFQRLMGANPSQFKHPQNPVEWVTWDECMEFCRRLSDLPNEKAAGRTYRLPTEAEWEYACRAGTKTRFHFGDDPSQLGNFAWCGMNSDSARPVGLLQPNAWGVYDMYGNVWERCLDFYGSYPGGSITDPTGASSGPDRVRRGGHWGYQITAYGSSYRDGLSPSLRGKEMGFRVVSLLSGE